MHYVMYSPTNDTAEHNDPFLSKWLQMLCLSIYMVKSGIEVIYMSYKPECQNMFSDTTPEKEPDFIKLLALRLLFLSTSVEHQD